MNINFWAVLVCAIASMVIGSLWYGPLFGNAWAKIIGADMQDSEARKKMQQSAGPLYFIQFLLVLFQASILAYLMGTTSDMAALKYALLAWAGFVMPTVAGSCMWNNESSKISWSRFWIQIGYQFILFVTFGLILGYWK